VDLLDMLAWARPRLSPPPRGRGRPANEHASYPHEVKEAVLAHALKNKVEAAYRRTDLFDKRRDMMDAWASFASSAGAKVVRLEA
jgi:hypothetical protein